MAATADQIVAKGGRLELRVETRADMLVAREIKESAILKVFVDRTRIDKKSGLRFNVMEFDGGLLKALGLKQKAGADTEIYIRGPYVQGKLGMGFMIRF
jgi:hypothetical protein